MESIARIMETYHICCFRIFKMASDLDLDQVKIGIKSIAKEKKDTMN